MNTQIRNLFLVFAFLFVALVGMSSYWLWRAPDLEARQGNPNLVVRQLLIERGLIYAADGETVFARNREQEVDGQTWFRRRYPERGLAAHVHGYSTIQRSRTGLEEDCLPAGSRMGRVVEVSLRVAPGSSAAAVRSWIRSSRSTTPPSRCARGSWQYRHCASGTSATSRKSLRSG